jgi:hypothetical protein
MLAAPSAMSSRLASSGGSSRRSSARPAASDSTVAMSAMPPAAGAKSRQPLKLGMSKPGSPAGTDPTTSTPWSARLSADTATMPSATATSGAGTRGEPRPTTRSSAIVAAPTANVVQLMSSSPLRMSPTFSKNPLPPTGMPRIFPSCPEMMNRPVPAL